MIYFTQPLKHKYPIITTSNSHIIGKFTLNQQILFALSKITNNCLGEDEQWAASILFYI